MEVKQEVRAVDVDLTPTAPDCGFSMRITDDWYILIRNKSNKLAMRGSLASVLMLMKESKTCDEVK